MRQIEVDNLLAVAREKGRSDIDAIDVCHFLGAKEMLRNTQASQYHKIATEAVNNFIHWMETGKQQNWVAAFLIPFEYIETEEEKAESARLGAEHQKYLRSTNQTVPHEE